MYDNVDFAELQEIIKEYYNKGFRLFPLVENSKEPHADAGSWVECKTWSLEQTLDKFPDTNRNLGLTAGEFVVIDLDPDKETGEFYSFNNLDSTAAQVTPRGGTHLLFKCKLDEFTSKDKKLKQQGINSVDIRCRNGYIAAYPSETIDGVYYWDCLDDMPPAVDELPELPKGYADKYLISVAEDTAAKAKTQAAKQIVAPAGFNNVQPGAAFNIYMQSLDNFDNFISGYGWQFCRGGGLGDNKRYYTRPGKATRDGQSANYDGSTFYVHTTADPILEAGNHSAFNCYALLECQGSHGQAAKELAAKGFGNVDATATEIDPPEPEETLELTVGENPDYKPELPDELETPYLKYLDIDKDKFQNLPGLLGEYVNFVKKHNPRYMPEITLGGALSLMSTLIGHGYGIKTYDTRANLYTICIAPSGSGKEFCRTLNKKILQKLGRAKGFPLITEATICSGPGVIAAIKRGEEDVSHNPFLWSIDEVEGLVRDFAEKRSQSMTQAQEVFLRAFTSVTGSLESNAKLNQKERTAIEYPYLNFMGVATTKGFFSVVNEKLMSGGFMGRCLCFASDEVPNPRRLPANETGVINVPTDLLNRCVRLSRFMGGYTEAQTNTDEFLEDILDSEENADGGFSSDWLDVKLYQWCSITWDILCDISEDCTKIANLDLPGVEPFARAPELIAKLALIYQVCLAPDAVEISLEALTWGRDIVLYCFAKSANRFRNPNNGFEAQFLNKLESAAMRANTKGLSVKRVSQIARRLENCPSPNIRKQMLLAFTAGGSNLVEIVTRSRNGRRTVKIYHRAFVIGTEDN